MDRFKAINDAIGHPGGDACCARSAELLVDGVRDTDEVCRWAGDEFVILLPDTTAEQAERALERIRRSVADLRLGALGLDFPVTISVGIASAARGDDRRTLFAAADGVLYDAKRSGRDRVVRLSGVTQTRAPGASPLDALFGPPPSAPTPTTRPGPRRRTRRIASPPCSLPRWIAAPSPPVPRPPRLPDPPLGTGAPTSRCSARCRRARAGSRRAPCRRAVEPEVVWATGRTTEQVLALVREARREHPDRPALVLRAAAETLVALASEHDAYTTMDAAAMAAAVGPVPEPVGRVACSAPAAPTPRSPPRPRSSPGSPARRSSAWTTSPAAASGRCSPTARCSPTSTAWSWSPGLDASLAAMVGGLADVPVVAVPTSTGARTPSPAWAR